MPNYGALIGKGEVLRFIIVGEILTRRWSGASITVANFMFELVVGEV